MTLKQQSWALIAVDVDAAERAWMEQLGIVIEDLGEVVDHDFLMLNTYTERQELVLRLRYGESKLIRLTVIES
jgi:hypothetical protein